LTLASLLVLTVAGTAFAAANHFTDPGDRTMEITASNCAECHAGAAGHQAGPHGGYASTTDKCQACHDVHGKAENIALLMGVTVTAACQYCHDLTATWAGPYNMNGLDKVGSAHRVVGIDVYSYIDSEGHANEPTTGVTIIPGGNGADGSEGVVTNETNAYTGKDPILSGQVFTCNSCHTPHGVRTVNPYIGESFVKAYNVNGDDRLYMTTRLLKQRPNNIAAADAVYEYTSEWCLGCHQGRDGLTVAETHNHPVNENQKGYQLLELAKQNGWFGGNVADLLARGTDADLTNNYVTYGDGGEISQDPRTNQQFVMTPGDFMNANAPRPLFDPINQAKYIDIGPACQQCHGSARDADQSWAFNFDPAAGNPGRASFPHLSRHKALLVEEADDFCTNCHDPNVLP
ncbi:MAG TPA: cytochrome c3 family protein, partial [Verrucomicrobiae bacterium]|nr:cytochrome c3 family protein [Verrucomicrobiae bacterium]